MSVGWEDDYVPRRDREKAERRAQEAQWAAEDQAKRDELEAKREARELKRWLARTDGVAVWCRHNGYWAIRGDDRVAGQTVRVKKSGGEISEEVIECVVAEVDGKQIAQHVEKPRRKRVAS